jgi:hypothetical protein
MAVTAVIYEGVGAVSANAFASPASATYLDFVYTSGAWTAITSSGGSSAYAISNPVPIPGSAYAYSWEKWFYCVFAGNTNVITGQAVYKSAGTYNTGYKIKALVKTPTPVNAVTPINTTSTYAGASGNEATGTSDLPIVIGSGLAPTYNVTSGANGVAKASDFIVAQLVVASTAVYGPAFSDTGTLTWSYQTTG